MYNGYKIKDKEVEVLRINTQNKLRELRGDRTQEEVAKGVGISTSTYAMYERGERTPRDRNKLAIAKYFDRSVGYIFFDEMDTKCEHS